MIEKSAISLVREAGQSLVEFALVLLFIILPVTVGIADGSILFYKWVVVTNGAREGARAGAIYHYQGASPPDRSWDSVLMVDDARTEVIIQTAEASVRPLVTIDNWTVNYPDSPCIPEKGKNCESCEMYDVYRSGVCRDGAYHPGGQRVTVTITHTHTPVVGLLIGLEQIDLTATATMRIELGGAAPTSPP